ncbi:hypothetical protein GC207_11035 [bacterium]|nr:hypothetical protein [bacterium]
MTLPSIRGRFIAASANRATRFSGLAASLLLFVTTLADASTEWSVPYGKEFWQIPHQDPSAQLLSAKRLNERASDQHFLDSTIDRVQHAFRPGDSHCGWQLNSATYRTRLTETGLEFGSAASLSGKQIHIRTLSVHSAKSDASEIDPHDFTESAVPWLVSGNTAQRQLQFRQPIVEHVLATSSGIEVTWVLNTQPNEMSDLTIDWSITGGGPLDQTTNGWWLIDASSVAGIFISEAVAVDSAGKRLPLKMRRTSFGLSINVPRSFLAAAQYPVAIDTLISTEFDLDQPVTRAAPSAQFAPAIASDGTNYLVVWHDNRSGAGLDLYAARVATNGTVLDPSGFAITTATNDQWYPAAAFNGTNYLVAWQDARNGGQDVYAARVTPSGRLLDTNGIPVVTLGNDQRLPSVASLNGDFLIAWQDGRNGTANQEIYAARIKGGGTLVETNGFLVSNASNSQSAPSLGTVGTNYVAAWHDFRSGVSLDVYAARITSTGSVLDTNGIPVSAAINDQWNVAITGNGTTGLIVWQDGRNGTDDELYGARINEAGTVLDPNGIAISQQAGQQRFPAVAAIGANFLVTWQDSRAGSDFNLYATTVSAGSGTVGSASGTLISDAANDQRYPAVALAGNQLLVAWEDIRNGSNADIFGSRIDANGASLDGGNLLVSTVSNSQETPAIASNGSIYLAVWRDYRNDSLGDIYGSRIASNGTVLDPSGIAICTAANYQQAPRVASNGSDFLVVWQDFRNGVHDDIMGSRVSNAGSVLDPNGFAITTALGAQRQPSIAGTPDGYLVVWQDRRGGTTDDIYGARVGSDGTVLDLNGLAVCTATGDQKSPTVAALNGSYFVAWEDFRSGVSNRVYGTRIQSTGQIKTQDGFALSSVIGEQQAPRIVASTNQFFAVWQGSANGTNFNIFGTRITELGIVQETNSVLVNASTGDQTHPAIASKGGDFMVVWEDQRTSGRTNLYSSRITANGTVLEPTGDLTAPETGKYRRPALANIGSDYLLVYQTTDAGNIQRVRGVVQYPTSEPTISLSPGSAQFVAESGAVPIDPSAILVDGSTANFESGTLTVDITANATPDDRLGIVNQGTGAGQIGLSGNQVLYSGMLIGFFTGGTSGTSPLLVIFSAAATADGVQALARNITFNNVASQPLTQPRTVRFSLNLTSGAGEPTTRVVDVIDAGSVPAILTQPVSQTTSASGTVTLSVLANGSQPITYQWRLNGQNIDGATNANYTISSVDDAKAGAYTVAISNIYDTIISDVATVTYFDIAMYAGVTIAGPIGAVYQVEYRPALGDGSTWTTLTNITLVSSPQLFFDPDSSKQNQRFYRAIRQE